MELSTTVLRILALETERATIYARTSQRWLNDLERGRLVDIRLELDRAWEHRRAEKAGAKAGHMIEAVISAATWDNRRGARLPG